MFNFSKKKKDGLALYPTALQRAALLQKAARGGPVVMLNLLKFKNKEAYSGYAGSVKGVSSDFGIEFLFFGEVLTTVIGDTVSYHAVALVRYPSIKAFIRFASSDPMKEFKKQRETGLEGQYLVAIKEVEF